MLVYICCVVGKIDVFLYSYFVLVVDDLLVQIVLNVQMWYIEQMMKGIEFEGLFILFVVVLFKVGGCGGFEYFIDVFVGDIVIKNVVDFYLYFNIVWVVKINGVMVKEWLECLVGMFNQIILGDID